MPAPSGGLMAAGGLAQGLTQGLETFLKMKRADRDQQREEAQLGLLARSKGLIYDPESGAINQTEAGKIKEQAELNPLRADSAGSNVYRGLLKKFGVDAPDDLTEAEATKLIDPLAKLKGIEENAALRRTLGAGISDDKRQKRITDLSAKLQKDLDPDASRTGNFGQISQRFLRAQNLRALATEAATGNVKNLDRRQQEELAIGLASMLGGGNQVTDARVNALVPRDARGDMNKIAEWFKGNPTGLDQQAFTKQMLETVEREADVAKEQMKSIQLRRLGAHSELKRISPDDYRRILSNYEINEDEDLKKKEPASENGLLAPQKNGLLGPEAPQTVRMRAPDGSIKMVPVGMVEAAQKAGGRVL